MRAPDGGARRGGFAVPLAVVLLIAVALMASLLLEAALSELRAGSAARAESRVVVAAESALAQGMAVRLDTAVLRLTAGARPLSQTRVEAESVRVELQVVQPGLARLLVSATSGATGIRVSVGRTALVSFRRDSLIPGEVVLSPIGPDWWIAVPDR